jgi:hypothetical protein
LASADSVSDPDRQRHAGQDDELLEPGSDLRMGIGDRDNNPRQPTPLQVR